MTPASAAPVHRPRPDRAVEYRCPTVRNGERCNRLLIVGRLPEPIEAVCPKCKRAVVVGGDQK